MRSSRRFTADSESVRHSRAFVIDTLVDAPSDIQASIAMMVSELATNAFIHGGSGFEVTIERTQEFIRVEVRDEGIGAPALQSPGPSEPHGRGLQIVMKLSSEWGISREPEQAGKTVWFKVSTLGDGHVDEGAVRTWRRIAGPGRSGARSTGHNAWRSDPGARAATPSALRKTLRLWL